MKYEWRKNEKNLYLPTEKPQIVNVPKQKFIAVNGKGDPNGEDFSEKIGVLYSLAYAVRMMPKSGYTPAGYFSYAVYPLEGVWEGNSASDKSSYVYTIMIRQPDFVTDEVINLAKEIVDKKKPHPILSQIDFRTFEDGLAIQMLHKGAYDDEPESFALMKQFMDARNLIRKNNKHREIYLSDAKKTQRSKLKTVLRYCVTENHSASE